MTEDGAGVTFLAPGGKDITDEVHERAFDLQVSELAPLPADVLRATMN